MDLFEAFCRLSGDFWRLWRLSEGSLNALWGCFRAHPKLASKLTDRFSGRTQKQVASNVVSVLNKHVQTNQFGGTLIFDFGEGRGAIWDFNHNSAWLPTIPDLFPYQLPCRLHTFQQKRLGSSCSNESASFTKTQLSSIW